MFHRHGTIAVLVLALTTAGSVVAPAAAWAEAQPQSHDDSFLFVLGLPASVPSPGILENDVDSSGYLIKVVSPPLHGRLSAPADGGNGGFTYTPNDLTVMSDAFSYCLYDGGECLSNTSTVDITFRRLSVHADLLTTPQATPLRASPSAILSNDDPAATVWSLLVKPRHGQITQPPDVGKGFVYTPDPGFHGLDSFRYCLSYLPGSLPEDCTSDQATVTISVGSGSVTRMGGADRFAVAVGVAQSMRPAGSAPVFVASGEGYADALSAGPAAAKQGAVMLLTAKGSLPAVTASEITRLKPMQVTVVGGPAAVSEAVVAEIKRLLPSGGKVIRVGGADRFAVSRQIAADVFGRSANAFVTTGTNFPDALSAGAAAGSKGEPVLLVDGQAAEVDAATKSTLSSLAASKVAIVGGPLSVSDGVETSLKSVVGVDRIQGTDRYETAVNVAKMAFTTADTVYLATGLNFPDALVGGVIAGTNHAPLYTVPGTCVPQIVLDDIARLGAIRVVLLGGATVLSPAVEQLTACP